MTRDEFIAEYRHELSGMILDAATSGKSGAELAVQIRHLMRKVDAQLGEMYDRLTTQTKGATK